jgi:transposase
MTIIKGDVELQIKTLKDAGLTGYKIAKQLNLKMSTVYEFLKKIHLYGSLPPKVKLYKGKIQGPMQINIKRYLHENPTATLKQIICALNLGVAESTLCNYLKEFGLQRTAAKREVLLSRVNKKK